MLCCGRSSFVESVASVPNHRENAMKLAWQWPDAWDMAALPFLMLDMLPSLMLTLMLAVGVVVAARTAAMTAAVAPSASAATWTLCPLQCCCWSSLINDGDNVPGSTWIVPRLSSEHNSRIAHEASIQTPRRQSIINHAFITSIITT